MASALDVSNFTPASAAPSFGDLSPFIARINSMAASNNVASAEQAAQLRDWQVQQNKIAMDFNMQEAAKNRDWQQMMSNTAHQREVADLKAAGLNPVLSAMGGNGAAVTSGATASGVTSSGSKGDVDTSANAALVGLLGSMLQAQSNLAASANSAISNLAVADKYTSMQRIVESMRESHEINLRERFPDSWPTIISSVLSGLGLGNGTGGTVTSAVQALSDAVQGKYDPGYDPNVYRYYVEYGKFPAWASESQRSAVLAARAKIGK